MGIYSSAIFIALIIVAAAIAFALVPEILERLPRRRPRREEHLLRPSADESRQRPRPALKREAGAEEADPPPSQPS